jgi:hypothetical protein
MAPTPSGASPSGREQAPPRPATPDPAAFERLGAFYLGRGVDGETGEATGDVTMLDSKDLTTHAVIVGMTGSGKTGLGISLIEEAAIDGIPAIVVDPKGDMGNLLLAFPELRPEDFAPWVDPGEATRAGKPPAEYAAEVAQRWRTGLAESGQDGERVRRFRDAAEATIYTPGSTAGVPLSVLGSFEAPPESVRDDAEAFREKVTGTASGLLALLGIDADPVRGREHVFLSTLLSAAWRAGRSLDLTRLVHEVQSPSFDRIGALDLESFYPAKERFELASALNGLLASPGFSAWVEGEPLDVGRLLWTPQGRPRLSILTISHLGDAERVFFLTKLLTEVVAWMRAQPGTSSLRALLYVDEVFGFFPPTANPPTKQPMLTLLKQARAFGLGVVLATQNPVDLDYKGLANAGTWFLGRLQTERDKLRVLEGLEGASTASGAAFDRARTEATLSGLGKRTFLLHSVHEEGASLLRTRWCLSYLRGPLTRVEIKSLAGTKAAAAPAASGAAAPAAAPRSTAATPATHARPTLPPEAAERFLGARRPLEGARLEYRPTVVGTAKVHYVDRAADVDAWETVGLRAPLAGGGDPWSSAEAVDARTLVLEKEPDARAAFSAVPAAVQRGTTWEEWGRALRDHLYRARPLVLFRAPELRESSRPGEAEGEFRVRLAQKARERRDVEVEALRRRYAPKVASLEERLRVARQRVQREASQYNQQKLQTGISLGATILGVLFGRRRGVGDVGRATTTMRGAGRASREKEDVARAEESAAALEARLAELNAEIAAETESLKSGVDPQSIVLERTEVAPRKTDTAVESLSLVWVPFGVAADGSSRDLS